MFSILIPYIRANRIETCKDLAIKNSGINSKVEIEIIAEEDTERIGCPKMLKRLVEKTKYDLIVFMGDDVEAEPDYLRIAYERIIQFPDSIGFVGFNDGMWDGDKDIATAWLANKKLLPMIGGEFFHTGYIHCRADVEMIDKLRSLGLYAWAPTSKIKHIHPLVLKDKTLMDEDYNRVYRPWVVQHDMELYTHRKNNRWQTHEFHEMYLQQFYQKMCTIKSDINEHLPTLREYASKVDKVTEFGFRNGISTIAMLAGYPRSLVTYDINPTCLQVYRHMKQVIHDTKFIFIQGNTREIDIADTDLLFIDSLHDYNQCKIELAKHSDKVSKYIILHDTETFGHTDESGGGRGLMPAIKEFIAKGKWKLSVQFTNNNGLIILKRK